ncbi:MAG TPA: nuclear transport factor 2 family protein [Candidatus Nanopelagicales bacterium]|nr:nuclear transport factor 2 family protein [Candidatus Nanopelagicales bacterium]
MKRWLPFGLIAIGVVLIAYALLGSSDEDRIRALLDRLAEAVRVEEGATNPLVRHGQVNEAFKEIFAKEASASVAELGTGIHGREELVRAATQVGSVYRVAYVTLGDVKLAIDSAGGTAEADARATITGAQHGQETRQDERAVKIRVEKIDGDWRIFSVTVGGRADGE